MTKILIKLDEMENRTVEHYKIEKKLKTKEEAVKEIIKSFKTTVMIEKAVPIQEIKKT